MIIVVIDTNVLLRAAFRRKTDSDNLLQRASRGEFQLVISSPLLEELEQTLLAPRLSRWFHWLPAESQAFLVEVRRVAIRVEPAFILEVIRDPSDNKVLEAAIEAGAEVIVSSDKDLLDLGSHEGISIVTEAHFLAILREAS